MNEPMTLVIGEFISGWSHEAWMKIMPCGSLRNERTNDIANIEYNVANQLSLFVEGNAEERYQDDKDASRCSSARTYSLEKPIYITQAAHVRREPLVLLFNSQSKK